MTLSAHERRALAEIERGLAAERRPRGAPMPLLLAVSWLACGLLFVALLLGVWVPAAIGILVAVGTLCAVRLSLRSSARRAGRPRL
jgi:hypothetical protein